MCFLFLGSYALCIKTPKSEANHFEDENTRDSLACRLGTSNCEVIVFQVSAIASSVGCLQINLRSFSLFWEKFEDFSVAN